MHFRRAANELSPVEVERTAGEADFHRGSENAKENIRIPASGRLHISAMRDTRLKPARVVVALVLMAQACSNARQSTSPSEGGTGSYTLSGAVTDTAFRPIGGAKVEILEGPQQNASVVTGVDGRFVLNFSSPATTMVRASKDGYGSETINVSPSSGVFVSFHLSSPDTVDLSGTYTLTFTADASCREIPEPLRTRTYSASIGPSPYRQGRTLFDVLLSGAAFLTRYNTFEIGVAGRFASIRVFNDPDEGEGIVEQLAPDTYLEITGSASTAIPDENWTTLSMPFDGYFAYCIGTDVFMSGSLYRCYMRQPRLLAECRSKNHRLDLTRVTPRSSR
jgi:hypothetical protein